MDTSLNKLNFIVEFVFLTNVSKNCIQIEYSSPKIWEEYTPLNDMYHFCPSPYSRGRAEGRTPLLPLLP